MHLHLSRIPKSIELETFYHITLLCEQYDCLDIISPWLTKWLKFKSGGENTGEAKYAKETKMFIYWAVGRVKLFRLSAKTMVEESALVEQLVVDDDGMSSVFDLDVRREIMPEGLYGKSSLT